MSYITSVSSKYSFSTLYSLQMPICSCFLFSPLPSALRLFNQVNSSNPRQYYSKKNRVSYFDACNQEISMCKCTHALFFLEAECIKTTLFIRYTVNTMKKLLIHFQGHLAENQFWPIRLHQPQSAFIFSTDPESESLLSAYVFINICVKAVLILRQRTCYCSICEHQLSGPALICIHNM